MDLAECHRLAPTATRLALENPLALQCFKDYIGQLGEKEEAERHPAGLLRHVSMPDEGTGGEFRFAFDDEGSGWYWQRELLDWWMANQRTEVLKARQLGVTWLAAGLGLWTMLYQRGSLGLVYRQKEEDASEIINRVWDMWLSVPEHLRSDAKVIAPTRGRPSTEIKWQFPNGRVSRMIGMASTESAGHGKTVAFALLDEFSRIEKASGIMKAVQPAVGRKGKILIVTTANGRSNPETGEGNYFHYLWVNAKEMGFQAKFLPWSLHPERDQDWYESHPEIRGLRDHERAEQYPASEGEAFAFTNQVYFDKEALAEYGAHRILRPLNTFDFREAEVGKAQKIESPEGMISLYIERNPEHEYAIGADTSTGGGQDYSAACVIDLQTMEIVAELHGRTAADLFAVQLQYLGRYFNTAMIAVERQGGYGEAVMIELRSGKDGRPPYPKLYRHSSEVRYDVPLQKQYGYPVNSKTRPTLVNQLERAIRERTLPAMSLPLFHECGSFIHRDKEPSPAAQGGMHDDLIFATCIALEMYRLRGEHPKRVRRKASSQFVAARPWEG